MMKTLIRAVTLSAGVLIAVLIYGELSNQLSTCPPGKLKVRLAEGGVGCVDGIRLDGGVLRKLLK